MSSSISFPTDLPIPLRDSYSETFEEIHSASDMEVGPSRRRARMRRAPRQFGLNLSLSQAEFGIFDNWWQGTVSGSASTFDIRLLDEDDLLSLVWYTVTVVDGQYHLNVTPVADYEVSFKVRSILDSFVDRDSGTDTLQGQSKLGMRNVSGRILIYSPYAGRGSLGLRSATAEPAKFPMRGTTVLGMSARARFT